jgi:hypothetical protein
LRGLDSLIDRFINSNQDSLLGGEEVSTFVDDISERALIFVFVDPPQLLHLVFELGIHNGFSVFKV